MLLELFFVVDIGLCIIYIDCNVFVYFIFCDNWNMVVLMNVDFKIKLVDIDKLIFISLKMNISFVRCVN